MSMEKSRLIDINNDFTEEEEAVFLPVPKHEIEYISLDETIIRKYKLGMTLKHITKEHGISYGKVYEILHRNNVPLRHGSYKATKSADRLSTMTGAEKQRLIDDYLSGMPLKVLFDQYNINKHGCYIVLDEAGIPRRHKQSTTTGTKVDKEKITFDDLPVEITRQGETLHITLLKKHITPVESIQLSFSFEDDVINE
jgi:hypothetical protein